MRSGFALPARSPRWTYQLSVFTIIDGAVFTLFEGQRGWHWGVVGEVSHGRQRVKPLCGSSASLRPFG